MDDVEHVSHCLCRMVDVALQVHKSRFLLKDSVFISFCHSVNYFVHVGISFANVHIIADTDDISHKGNHICGLAHGLTVRHLRFALVKILNFKT